MLLPERSLPGAASDPMTGSQAPHVCADWVFAYGSLIWNPGFEFCERHLARVHGYHRTFCIRSVRYRGTPESPGVVLGLDRGGSCVGVAYHLREDCRQAAMESLYEREMTGQVYHPRVLYVRLQTGLRVAALAFVADRSSPAYERLADDQIVQRLAHSQGSRGPNRDYALNTWRSLLEHGVHCPHLTRIGRHLTRAK